MFGKDSGPARRSNNYAWRMQLDLALLKEMHPLLPVTTASEYGYCAALGLQRHQHASGVRMTSELDGSRQDTILLWDVTRDKGEQLDHHRITEHAAEAISLALVSVAFNWVVRRRLQRGEAADWLLQDDANALVALEVSGLNGGDSRRRLREKTVQAGRATICERRVACVIQLSTPRADLATAA